MTLPVAIYIGIIITNLEFTGQKKHMYFSRSFSVMGRYQVAPNVVACDQSKYAVCMGASVRYRVARADGSHGLFGIAWRVLVGRRIPRPRDTWYPLGT